MKYKIVEAYTPIKLSELVEYEIKKGWEPIGGINTSVVDATRQICYQSMVHKENTLCEETKIG